MRKEIFLFIYILVPIIGWNQTRIENSFDLQETYIQSTSLLLSKIELPILTVGLPVELPVYGTVPQMVWSATSPDDSGRILICSFGWNAYYRRSELNAYLSSDGGNNWDHVLQDASTPWVSEISCAFGLKGAAYIVAGASKRSGITRGHVYGEMHVYSSSNGGITWKGPTKGPFIDWTATTVDATAGPHRGRIYIFGHDISNGNGSWVGPAKPLLTSSNGGKSFSEPVFAGKWPEDGGGYPLAASVLRNGNVIALYRKERPGAYVIAVSRDGGKTLKELTPIPRDSLVTNLSSTSVGFAVDQSRGLYSGRFYLAYPAIRAGKPSIILARSDDGGVTWRNSVATPFVSDTIGNELGFAGIAVNKDGIVGLTWSEPKFQRNQFSLSLNGGDSFEPSVALRMGKAVQLSYGQQLQNYVQTMGTYEPDAPPDIPPGAVAKGRGLSIRLSNMGLNFAQLSADALGAFHPVWTELRENDRPVLMTTRVTVSTTDPPLVEANINKLYNFTNKIIVDINRQQFDATSGTYILSFTLTNVSDSIVYGPIRILLSELTSGNGFGEVEVLNSDNGITRKGAIFDLTETLINGRLLSGESTAPFRIGFRVKPIAEPQEIANKIKNGAVIHPVSSQIEIYVGRIDNR